MKVIVCGSRTFTDRDLIYRVLNGQFVENCYGELISIDDLVIVTGGAKGADRFAEEWAKTTDTDLAVFEAQWDRYNMAAGPIRNRQMLDFGADMVVAFVDKPLHESKGTYNMVRMARDAGVRTIVIEVTPSATSRQQSSPQLF